MPSTSPRLAFALLIAAIGCATGCGDDSPAGGGHAGGAHAGGAGGSAAAGGGAAPTPGGGGPNGGQPEGGTIEEGGATSEGGSANQGGGGSPPCAPTGEETCASPLDEECDGTECGLWGYVYGNTGSQMVRSLELAPNGDVYLIIDIGDPGDSIDFDGQTIAADADHDNVLAKLSASGQELWVKLLPSEGGVYRVLGATNDGVFITAHMSAALDLGGGPLVPDGWNDFAFAAYDNDGDYVWSTTIVAPGFEGTNFLATGISPSNQIVIAGSAGPGAAYEGIPLAEPGSTADPIWYGLAIDANTGVLQWRHEWQISDPNQGVIRSLTFDDGGDIFLAGYSIPGTMSFGGPTIQVGPPPGGWSQGFVVHLDPNGEWVAGNTFCDQCIPWKIALGPGGEIIVAGIVNFYQLGNIPTPPGNNDRGVFRLDASTFQPMWAKFMNEIPDIAIGIDGQIGFSFGSEDIYLDGAAPLGIGTRDLIIGKITMNGTIPWYRLFGAPGAVLDDIGLQTYRAQPDGKAIVYITASGPPVDFGFGPMTFPSSNVALMQIAP